MREVYLNAVPSVDLNEVSADAPIDCRKHTIPESVYERIVSEFDLMDRGDGNDGLRAETRLSMGLWLLNGGPRICE